MTLSSTNFFTSTLIVTSPFIPTFPALNTGVPETRGLSSDDVQVGGDAFDVFNGGAGDDRIEGGAGDDILIGGSGDDSLDGDDGFDAGYWRPEPSRSIIYVTEDGFLIDSDGSADEQGFVFEVADVGSATRADGLERDVFSNLEMIIGTDFGDVFNVAASASPGVDADYIYLRLGAGDDHVENDGGQVMVDYFRSRSGVEVDLTTGIARDLASDEYGEGIGIDQLNGVNAVLGSLRADLITGSSDADFLVGEAGNDVIFGGDGGDVIYGDEHLRHDAFFGRDHIPFYGPEYDNALYGGDGDDRIIDGDGSGVVNGGAGDDVLSATGEADGDFFGGAGDDVVSAGYGAANLFGEEGNDLLIVRGIVNVLDGGAGRDTADLSIYQHDLKVNLTDGFLLSNGCRFDMFQSIERVIGSQGDDVLIGTDRGNYLGGGDGDDMLIGRGGRDALAGNLGNDIYALQQVGDRIYENAGEGYDRINTWVDVQNAENVEMLSGKYADEGLRLIGHGDRDRIYGSEFADKIDGWRGDDWAAGLGGDDYMNGGAGDDALYGNGGDDVLRGGRGDDWLAGHSGADRFVHRAGDGADTVRDFTAGQDVLDLSGHDLTNFYAFRVAARDVDGGVLVYLGDGGSLMLQGVSELDLSAGDVII